MSINGPKANNQLIYTCILSTVLYDMYEEHSQYTSKYIVKHIKVWN